MSWCEAPLYVRTHDLARWVMERLDAMNSRAMGGLEGRVGGAASDLLAAVGLALTFPADRGRHLRDADEAIVRLRLLLRLAADLGLLPGRSLRYAEDQLIDIGRMVGGWRKRVLAQADDAEEVMS